MANAFLHAGLRPDGRRTFRLKQFGEQTGPEIKGIRFSKKALEGEESAEHAGEEQTEPGARRL